MSLDALAPVIGVSIEERGTEDVVEDGAKLLPRVLLALPGDFPRSLRGGTFFENENYVLTLHRKLVTSREVHK